MTSKRNNALKNRRQFEHWVMQCEISGRCSVLQHSIEGDKVTKKEFPLSIIKDLVPVYPFDENNKYHNVLQELGTMYYVGKQGLLISMKNETPRLISPCIKNSREYYSFSIKRNGKNIKVSLQIAALINLVYGGRATKNAQMLLNDFGVDAIRKLSEKELKNLLKRKGISEKSRSLLELLLNMRWKSYQLVQINHEDGYASGETFEEIRAKRAYNCDVARTQFEFTLEHVLLTNVPSKDASNEEVNDYFGKYVDIPFDNPVFVIPYEKNAGTIIDDISNSCLETTDFGKHKYHIDDIKLAGFCYKANILLKYDDGTYLEKGVNVSRVDYMYFEEKYRTFLKDYGTPTNVYLGQSIDNKEVYGFCEVV